jgi:hypothetical protein
VVAGLSLAEISCGGATRKLAPAVRTPPPPAAAARPPEVPIKPPQWRGLSVIDAPALPPGTACAIGAFAVYVHPDGAVVADRVHVIALSSAEADPAQIDRMRDWAGRSRWRPATIGSGSAASGWAELILDCRGRVWAPNATDAQTADHPIDAESAGKVEAQLPGSAAARLAAAQLLAASDPRGLDPKDAMWHLDAVRVQFATLQSRRPFFYDVLKDALPEELPRGAEEFWWVCQAATSHTGTFVFLTPEARVLGACRYLIGE